MASTLAQPPPHHAFTIGWLCALPKEQTAALAVLEERYAKLPNPPNDSNTYNLGSINGHNIVITCLPKGTVGTSEAAAAVVQMVNSFPGIKAGLMVGIGGGVPPEVRLGDIVVSTPVLGYPGVIPWDLGKATSGGGFVGTGSLKKPARSLLAALTSLEAEQPLTGSRVPDFLEEVKSKWPKLGARLRQAENLEDVLYKPEYDHRDEPPEAEPKIAPGDNKDPCRYCSKSQTVPRPPRDENNVIHYGLIASGNKVVKDAAVREEINRRYDNQVRCVEMEAAGLMDHFPCIVIRGICDYADSHKNDGWHEYAACVAAAFAKELLYHVPLSHVAQETPLKEMMSSIAYDVSEVKVQVKLMQQKEEDRTTLDWLIMDDYGTRHSEILKQRQPGTGMSLIQSDTYENWIQTKGNTLYCPGIPGAGKTVMSSMVVQDLMERFPKDDIGIAFVYCEYKQEDMQSIGMLLASILKQLASCVSLFPQQLNELYKKHFSHRTRPSDSELSKVLQSITTSLSRTFVIIDALDECQNSTSATIDILRRISDIQNDLSWNLFATSRHNALLQQEFSTCVSFEVRATDPDIRAYLESHIESLPSFVAKDTLLRERVIQGIIDAADGMFLLARLSLDSFHGKFTDNEVFAAITNLAKGSTGKKAYDQAYDKIMERIQFQTSAEAELANRALAWVSCARRLLTESELLTALSLKVDTPQFSMGDMIRMDISSLCAGLLNVDARTKTIRLTHYTTQEYFDSTKEKWFPHAEADMAATCIRCLSCKPFVHKFMLGHSRRKSIGWPGFFYIYAACHWGHHDASMETPGIREFLVEKELTDAASLSLTFVLANGGLSYPYHPLKGSALHLASYFGKENIVEFALKFIDPHHRDRTQVANQSPLSWLAMGHPSWPQPSMIRATAKRLLDAGASMEAQDRWNGNSLWVAASTNNRERLRIFLDQGATLESKIFGSYTPLLAAVNDGMVDMVQLFLQEGANIEARDELGLTALLIASARGHKGIVNLLLQEGADAKVRDSEGRNALATMAHSNEQDVGPLLLGSGVFLEAQDNKGRTPLMCAAESGKDKHVQFLLDEGADIEVRDKTGQTALMYAVFGGTASTVSLLLSHGALIEARDDAGQTALVHATKYDRGELVQLLLDQGANIETQDELGRTLPLIAVRSNSYTSALILCKHGASLDTEDVDGQTLIRVCAAGGKSKMMNLLLSHDVAPRNSERNIVLTAFVQAKWRRWHDNVENQARVHRVDNRNSKSNGSPTLARLTSGNGPLQRPSSSEDGNPETLQLTTYEIVLNQLLSKGADPNLKLDNDSPLLIEAFHRKDERLLLALICSGADLSAQDADKCTLLHYVCCSRSMEITRPKISELLKLGADIEAKARDGTTPLLQAVKMGSLVGVQELLDQGANLQAKQTDGTTSLHHAMFNHDGDMVRLLHRAGADALALDSKGISPVRYIFLRQDPSASALEPFLKLFETGADVNGRDDEGMTPFLWESKRNHFDIIKIILASDRADELSLDKDFRGALYFAAGMGYTNVVEFILVSEGANTTSPDKDVREAFSFAVSWGYTELVEFILASERANITSLDKHLREAFSFAVSNGYPKLVETLLDSGQITPSTNDFCHATPQAERVMFSYTLPGWYGNVY